MSANVKNRFDYIDYAKSLTMFLIIWAHIRLGDRSNAFSYAFHIPLYFVISGMVFDKARYKGCGDFFKKKNEIFNNPVYLFFYTNLVFVGKFLLYKSCRGKELFNALSANLYCARVCWLFGT